MKITNFKYMRHAVFLGGLVGMAVLFSRCSSSSSGSGGSAATSFSISGNMDVGVSSMSVASVQQAAKLAALDAKLTSSDVNAMATQCSDGFYYNVYCLSYSEPPVAATGAVTCSGNSGSFTVAGLPLNAEIGCFVRRSADNSSYTTLGTLEIPTTSLSGGTTSIVSQGNLQLAITLSDDGSITTTVTGGADNVVPPTSSADNVDPTKYNGIWAIQCDDSTVSSTLYDPVKCKCQQSEQSSDYSAYQQGGAKNPIVSGTPAYSDSHDACIHDNASVITSDDTKQFVEINMYTATPASNVTTDNGGTIAAGTHVPVISVWSASDATHSARGTGGEGAGSSVNGVNLTWNTAQATNPILWTVTGTHNIGNGVSVDFGTAQGQVALPTASTVSVGTWKNYLTALYNNATGFTCTWSQVSGTGSTDAGCLGEFANDLRNDQALNLPSIRMDRDCSQMGCDGDVTHAKLYVDGYDVDYSSVSSTSSNNSLNTTLNGISPKLRSRYVFEPFEATPTGGGFTQQEYENRGYSCSAAGPSDIVDSRCNGTNNNWVNCGTRKETAIRFVPDTSSSMKIVFEQRSSVTWASLDKWSGSTDTQGSFTDAMDLCSSKISAQEGRFQMSASK
ncbi:MAG: hypothetical protein ACXVAX_04260 [Pseudobdellovibrio sp.]